MHPDAERYIGFQDYLDCLYGDEDIYREQVMFGTRKHQIMTQVMRKKALSKADEKRYILDDGITTLAHGHYKIPTLAHIDEEAEEEEEEEEDEEEEMIDSQEIPKVQAASSTTTAKRLHSSSHDELIDKVNESGSSTIPAKRSRPLSNDYKIEGDASQYSILRKLLEK
ncbi:uncharacterized protein LOC120351207 isoform X2 [Nilaparvata lugens]|uniref:uncharacterized protein LOC120351207 isoform X2 n=1 Tax=Nilaparvata lugens TaxID=108931 RepID=UPI00193D3940|nr:uncharacterized protein LOC120351207 isoform X2 [Nilaparvata lugens]